MLTLNIIGAGRLGKTLGLLFTQKNLVQLQDICNTHLDNSLEAVKFIGQGHACPELAQLSAADLYLIAAPDAHIQTLCEKIIETTQVPPHAIFFHCSGALSSQVLSAAKNKNHLVASIHPIKSFADPIHSSETFAGTFCATQGDTDAVTILSDLFTKIGGECFAIKEENKALYHTAGVIANNYAVGLFAQAQACYQLAGIDEKTAHDITYKLFNDALLNLQHSTPEKALTGPLQRGDITTIAQHIQALHPHPELLDLYRTLALATLNITQLSTVQKQLLIAILKG